MKTKDNLPPRPYWTGFLKLSLVTCGVRLYTATTEARSKFHRIHGPTGEPVTQPWQVEGVGKIDSSEVVKGYEYAKGQHVIIDPDELKQLKIGSTDVIDIAECVEHIDPVYYGAAYYLVPEGGASEQAYRTICVALRRTGMIAIGQVVIRERERVIAIRATEHGLIANALHFPEEVRDPERYYLAVAAVDNDEVALMEQIITRKLTGFAPEKYVDHYEAAVRDLIDAKLAGVVPTGPVDMPRTPATGNLMDALKRSLALEAGDAPAPVKPKGKRAKARSKA